MHVTICSGGRLNSDVINTILFVRQLAVALALPRAVLERFIPAYILEAAAISV